MNRQAQETFVGRQRLATELGVSVRAVDKAIAALVERGHLSVMRSAGGRGVTNHYRPTLDGESVETANSGSSFSSKKRRTDAPQNGEPAFSETANQRSTKPVYRPDLEPGAPRTGQIKPRSRAPSQECFVVMPNSPQWAAWRRFRNASKQGIEVMDKLAREGRGITVTTEWPPAEQSLEEGGSGRAGPSRKTSHGG